MNAYSKPVFIFGIILPVIVTATILTGCLITFNHYHKKLIRQTRIFNAINSCKQQLQGAEQEAHFLDAEISAFKSTSQFDDLASEIQKAASSEKGTTWVGTESPSSDQRTVKITGLNGPTVPIIGEAFKRTPTILIDSWSIQRPKKAKKLNFKVTAILPITERSE